MINYRVWHNSQVTSTIDTFYVDVKDIEEGVLVMNVLADYDLFQFKNNIRLDYSNAQGLQQCEEELILNDHNWEDFEICESDTCFSEPEEYLAFIKD